MTERRVITWEQFRGTCAGSFYVVCGGGCDEQHCTEWLKLPTCDAIVEAARVNLLDESEVLDQVTRIPPSISQSTINYIKKHLDELAKKLEALR